ncbi:hypothetical protein ACFQPA_13640 [Halomarina halobia]|uniref:Small CPxCG-related zinc finger protein n=1 Tax=Halomarina halobia TaxID=3033386 RepID=A0ABD6A9S2_9EURY|nr:hypothetical protein [Halomarina sp. PSR21]
MARKRCDGCGQRVRIAGGIGDLWSFEGGPSGGLTLELADGTEYFLCFDCLGRLPDDPTPDDVAALDGR